jgi:5-methylthioadenosine/S-adenosylhomocysteine deaminase
MTSVPETGTVPDLLVAGGDVVTMNARREIYRDGAVAIAGGEVVAVDGSAALRERWPDVPVHDARGTVVTPGLVNTHQHLTGDPLLRSCIPDLLPQGRSIFSWSVPLHSVHTAEHDELAATVGALESLRNGVTTVVEAGTMAHPLRAAAGMRAAGLRGTVGVWGWDEPGQPYAYPAEESLARQREVVSALPPGGQVEGWVTLVGHGLASDELLAGAAALARECGTRMTMHLSPTRSDPETYLERFGVRPMVHLDRLGVLGEHLLIGHGVWLDDDEVEAMARTGTAVSYCPWAYLRLGQGVTANGRHAELARRGVPVGLGCDSVNAGDRMDILLAASLAAGLERDVRIDPTCFGAHDAFEWATVGGAAAAGMSDRIGALEPGLGADLVVFDSGSLEWSPEVDPVMALVWGTDGRSVRDVFVGGELVVADRHSTRIDEVELRARARAGAREVVRRAGIEVPVRWPVRGASDQT